MSCRHCDQILSSQEELVAHLKYHDRIIENRLRRDGPLTFGARYRRSTNKGDEHAKVEEGTSATITSRPSHLTSGSFSLPQRSPTVTSHPVTDADLGSSPRDNAALHTFLAKVMASDSSLLIFRRYAKLNIQNILYLQEILARLESDLDSACSLPMAGDSTRAR
ncbi:unnamed protein product [Penicillium palitans]